MYSMFRCQFAISYWGVMLPGILTISTARRATCDAVTLSSCYEQRTCWCTQFNWSRPTQICVYYLHCIPVAWNRGPASRRSHWGGQDVAEKTHSTRGNSWEKCQKVYTTHAECGTKDNIILRIRSLLGVDLFSNVLQFGRYMFLTHFTYIQDYSVAGLLGNDYLFHNNF